MAEPPITVRAIHDSGGGNLTPTRVVIHSTVGGGFPGASRAGMAHSVARYFTMASSGGSAHYIVDVASEEHCVPDSVVAWHAPPNPHSIGIEIASEPTYTRAQWTDPAVWPAVERAAARTAELCNRFGIPKVWLSTADLLAGRHGVTSHNNVSQAWHQSSHWDPGPNFPVDLFMQAVGGSTPAPPTPPPVGNVGFSGGLMAPWPLPPGHYLGDINGPSNCHGGDPRYDSDQVRWAIEGAQRNWIAAGLVPGVPASQWRTSGWADGKWDPAYSSPVCRAWFARFRNSQPIHDQVWSDDYAFMRGQSF